MMNAAKNMEMFDTITGLRELDEACIRRGKEIFENYLQKGIIKGSTFSDIRWQFSDEYSNVGIRFNLNEVAYNRYYKNLFEISYEDFIDYVKTYVMYTMGKIILNTLRDTVNDIKRIFSINPLELDVTNENVFISNPNRIMEFVTMLPSDKDTPDIEKLIETLEQMAELRYTEYSSVQRPLASFDSYFLFNDIMNDFWKSDMEQETRLFYYPLYLWWQFTGVIPLRPREFILTPRNCLEEKEDGCYITLRRNQLKGGSSKVTYQINSDYIKVQYKIPDRLAATVREYIRMTDNYAPTELDTLFISDTHYRHWGQCKHKNSRYFTYINLHCVLRYFFHEIIEEKYHLEIIYDRGNPHLKEGQINYLYLGDTRHLALINIIAEGGTPLTTMMLAGHDNPEMSAHYYSNITHLIECRTYKQYRKVLKGNVTYNISPKLSLPDRVKVFSHLDDGGRCYSEAYRKNNVSDCLKAVGMNGEIGYCPECSYYARSGSQDFYDNDDVYKRKIEDDCIFLKNIVKQVRLGISEKEDIWQALLRLQSSSVTYQKYFEQKLKYIEEKGDNKVWEENLR